VATDRSSAPTWTLGFVVLWGCFTVFVASAAPEEYPSPAISVATAILGLVTIALGLAVYRRKSWAAWTLAGLAVLDIMARIRFSRSGYGLPGILLALALTSAFAIRKETQVPETQNQSITY
jgi:hypothetical protein